MHHWQLMTDAEIERIRAGAIRVLAKTGFRFLHREILEGLEKRGCPVDFTTCTASVTSEIVSRLEQAARASAPAAAEEPLLRRLIPAGSPIGHNFTCYYDATEGARRAARLDDIRNVVRAWHMLPEITHSGPCMTAQDVPAPIEPIVSTVETLKLTDKIRHCPEMILGAQLPYLEELETLMNGTPTVYRASGCSVNRFTLDERAAECLLAVHKRNGLEQWWINSCPVTGFTAPVTLAGAIVVGVAETMGGWLAGWALNEAVGLNAIPLAGVMDMQTGRVLFSAPEAILLNAALYQFFHRLYGLRIGLCAGYTDAKVPGLQAMNDKLLRSLAFGWFTDEVGGQNGTLDAGNIYSPTQQVLDLEINRQTARLARGFDVSEEDLCLEGIERLAARSDGVFLGEEHTLRHFRETLWQPALMDRSAFCDAEEERRKDRELVDRAEAKWRNALASYHAPEQDADKITAAEQVVSRARRALLAS
ncbi:MAG: trimethylamine methyltransferase family protein [Lentisphaerae bacterium]|nr:trimethylamine methyltransferase family protein [Lentisphaerota bacterium]